MAVGFLVIVGCMPEAAPATLVHLTDTSEPDLWSGPDFVEPDLVEPEALAPLVSGPLVEVPRVAAGGATPVPAGRAARAGRSAEEELRSRLQCAKAVIACAEGDEVIPQTVLHLNGEGSYSANGNITKWEWEVEQPAGSQSVFLPSNEESNPSFEANVAGVYTFALRVWNDVDSPSCLPAGYKVVVIPDTAIHVELLWHTPEDPDETDSGPGAGADVDLHFQHPFASGPDLDGCGTPDGWCDPLFDCFSFNPHPEWGSYDPAVGDNPHLDRDDSDGAGPENINLAVAEDVVYRVGAHYWDDHGYGASYATVRVFLWSDLVFEVADLMLVDMDMWDVCTIDWAAGEVHVVASYCGQYKITPQYYCQGQSPGWYRGGRDPPVAMRARFRIITTRQGTPLRWGRARSRTVVLTAAVLVAIRP